MTDIGQHGQVTVTVNEALHYKFVEVCYKHEVSASQILNTWAAALMREWVRLDAEEDKNAQA